MSLATRGLCGRGFLASKWIQNRLPTRNLLTESMQCREAWRERLAAPIFSKIRMGEYFVEIDRKFANESRGSAVDVDIFANNVQNETESEQMEELLYKLRRTPSTIHTPASTHHAAVRALVDHGQVENLVKLFDDRINYGVFMDEFTAAFVLDKLYMGGDFRAGARVAAQLMMQEEDFPLAKQLGLLCCWQYLSEGRTEGWYYPGEVQEDPNPDDVIRVRVRMVPNNYFDDHFDLKEPDHLLGKTLVHLSQGTDTVSYRSIRLLGYMLWGKEAEWSALLKESNEVASSVLSTLESVLPDLHARVVNDVKVVEVDLSQQLLDDCSSKVATEEEKFKHELPKMYNAWSQERDNELKRQYENLQKEARIQHIEQTKVDLSSKEEKLFFFDHYDRYIMEKEDKVKQWARTLPSTNWNMKWFPMNKYYKKKPTGPDGERKMARWEKREQKKGPPK